MFIENSLPAEIRNRLSKRDQHIASFIVIDARVGGVHWRGGDVLKLPPPHGHIKFIESLTHSYRKTLISNTNKNGIELALM